MPEPRVARVRPLPFVARRLGWSLCRLRWCLALMGAVWLAAQDPRPTVGPGATKDEVIDAYGWPTGQSKLGTKEVLSYPQGRVTLENGRVESVAFTMKTPWPAPRPRPGAAAAKAKKAEPAVDFWLTRFDDATREAARRHAGILVVFTGSDWSPASRQFDEEVAQHPDFVNAFTAEYVFLRLDFAARPTLAPEVREQNNTLRERYGVTTYPALLVLAATGDLLAKVDLTKAQSGETYRARLLAALAEARTEAAKRASALAAAAAPPAAPAEPVVEARAAEVSNSLFGARRVVTGALGLGLVIAALLFWLVWRNWAPAARGAPEIGIKTRISDAASGLPSQPDLAAWPRGRLVALVAAFVEADGFHAEIQPAGGDKDIVLRRHEEEPPHVVILCAGDGGGPVPAKRIREFFGTMTAEGFEAGWYVAPAGFAAEARAYAEQHNIRILDGPGLTAQLRDLPPLVLAKVLAKSAG